MFDLIVDLTTAKALGLIVRPSLLAQADEPRCLTWHLIVHAASGACFTALAFLVRSLNAPK